MLHQTPHPLLDEIKRPRSAGRIRPGRRRAGRWPACRALRSGSPRCGAAASPRWPPPPRRSSSRSGPAWRGAALPRPAPVRRRGGEAGFDSGGPRWGIGKSETTPRWEECATFLVRREIQQTHTLGQRISNSERLSVRVTVRVRARNAPMSI